MKSGGYISWVVYMGVGVQGVSDWGGICPWAKCLGGGGGEGYMSGGGGGGGGGVLSWRHQGGILIDLPGDTNGYLP